MNQTYYSRLVYTFALMYPLYWLALAVSSKVSLDVYSWLIGADVIGGENGPTSLFLVQGQFRLGGGFFLAIAGLVLLTLFIVYKRYFPGGIAIVGAILFGTLVWFLSTSSYLYWATFVYL